MILRSNRWGTFYFQFFAFLGVLGGSVAVPNSRSLQSQVCT